MFLIVSSLAWRAVGSKETFLGVRLGTLWLLAECLSVLAGLPPLEGDVITDGSVERSDEADERRRPAGISDDVPAAAAVNDDPSR